jgi:hypothetical protein
MLQESHMLPLPFACANGNAARQEPRGAHNFQ